MAQFRVEKTIFERFPGTMIGVIVADQIVNSGVQPEVLAGLAAEAAALPERLTGDPAEHPYIAIWRTTYQQFGVKPKKYPSSVENLTRRVLNGYQPGHINTLVDAYNWISLKHLLPVGGEDLDKTSGDIVLTFAGDAEPVVKLLGEADERAPYAGEVIYKDDISAICRRWNWKEADRTKLTEETKRAVLVLEALPPVSRITLQTALDELDELLRTYCAAHTTRAILDAMQPVIDLEI
jgi:DNA/RNA-binding domain of Phe-tRNA-synthetase-like protein